MPRVTSQWILESAIGSKGLKLVHNVPIGQLADHDVLMKVHAVSINSRDNQVVAVRIISALSLNHFISPTPIVLPVMQAKYPKLTFSKRANT